MSTTKTSTDTTGEITAEQMRKLRHAVGFYSDEPGFRNYYWADSSDTDWEVMAAMDFAVAGAFSGSQRCYSVTKKGKQLIGLSEQRQFARAWRRRMSDMQDYYEDEMDG